ncbi:MAG: pilus assembly protein [Planctomycetes bacterium]|nr:pilus assembly protein [Planctomycetota bacterium]
MTYGSRLRPRTLRPAANFARRLRAGERGVSMVEMAILSPMYLLLIVACIFAGDCTLSKLGCVQAVRQAAWTPNAKRTYNTGSAKGRWFAHLPGRVTSLTDKEDRGDWTNSGDVRKSMQEGLGVDPAAYAFAGDAAKLLNQSKRNGNAISRGSSRVEFQLDPIGASGWLSFPKPKFISIAATDLPGKMVFRNTEKVEYKNNRPWHEVMDGSPPWPKYRKKNKAWEVNYNPLLRGPIIDLEMPF